MSARVPSGHAFFLSLMTIFFFVPAAAPAVGPPATPCFVKALLAVPAPCCCCCFVGQPAVRPVGLVAVPDDVAGAVDNVLLETSDAHFRSASAAWNVVKFQTRVQGWVELSMDTLRGTKPTLHTKASVTGYRFCLTSCLVDSGNILTLSKTKKT